MIIIQQGEKDTTAAMYRILCWVILCFLFISCKTDPQEYSTVDPISAVPSGYVGSKACIACHSEAYDKWQGSHHDLAMQVANDSTVLGDFNNVKVEIDGVSYLFFKKNNEFFIRIKEIDEMIVY